MKLLVGGFAKVTGGKVLPVNSFVELLIDFGDGVFLCGSSKGNFVVVEKNLVSVSEE